MDLGVEILAHLAGVIGHTAIAIMWHLSAMCPYKIFNLHSAAQWIM